MKFVLAFLLCLVTANVSADHMPIGFEGGVAWYCTSPEPLEKIIAAKTMEEVPAIIEAGDCLTFASPKLGIIVKEISASFDPKIERVVEIYKVEIKHIPSQPAYVMVPRDKLREA